MDQIVIRQCNKAPFVVSTIYDTTTDIEELAYKFWKKEGIVPNIT